MHGISCEGVLLPNDNDDVKLFISLEAMPILAQTV